LEKRIKKTKKNQSRDPPSDYTQKNGKSKSKEKDKDKSHKRKSNG
jgi:hypothetical protein